MPTNNSIAGVIRLAPDGTVTGGLQIPRGTTAQRPPVLVAGLLRLNTTTNQFELYNGSAWINPF
jgi:hypothetical protein